MSDRTHRFLIKSAPDKHTGKGRVLINYQHRDGAKRFEIVRIVGPGGKQGFAAAIGHYDEPRIVKMDYDLRATLGLEIDDEVDLEVRRGGWLGTMRWYLTTRDPQVRLPALLGVLSVALGILSLVLSLQLP